MRLLLALLLSFLVAACSGNVPEAPEAAVQQLPQPYPEAEAARLPETQQELIAENAVPQPARASELKVKNIYNDLVVSEGELLLNRTRVYLHGNLVVNGTGKLKVVDSEMHFVQDFNRQYGAFVSGDAVVEMANARLFTGGKWFNFDYGGNAVVRFDGVRGEGCCLPWHGSSGNAKFVISSSTVGITLNQNVTIVAGNKSSLFFELVLTGVNGTFRLPKGHVEAFDLEIPNDGGNLMSVHVSDSEFYHWGTTLDKHTRVSFIGTGITIGINAGSDWQLPPAKVKASGLKARLYNDYTLDFDTNTLHLKNTEVTSWYPQAWNGATIELADSDLADLQNNGRDSKLIVRNSKVDIAIARENVVHEYYDSEIRQDVIAFDDAKIYLYNTLVRGEILEKGNGMVFVDGRRISSQG